LGPAPSRDTNREARSKFSNLRAQCYHLIINGKYWANSPNPRPVTSRDNYWEVREEISQNFKISKACFLFSSSETEASESYEQDLLNFGDCSVLNRSTIIALEQRRVGRKYVMEQ
jgi:hypothetical protein